MPALAPNTPAIAGAMTNYLSALRYSNNTLVYSFAQLEAIKDITDYVANGQACVEVYGNNDDSQHHAYNGIIKDIQSWYLLSMCGLDTPTASSQIYAIRDALVQPFMTHATLGDAGNVFKAQIKQNTGKFVRLFRNGIEIRAHLVEIETESVWQVPYPGVVS